MYFDLPCPEIFFPEIPAQFCEFSFFFKISTLAGGGGQEVRTGARKTLFHHLWTFPVSCTGKKEKGRKHKDGREREGLRLCYKGNDGGMASFVVFTSYLMGGPVLEYVTILNRSGNRMGELELELATPRARTEDGSSLAGLAAPCEGRGAKNEDGIGGCR